MCTWDNLAVTDRWIDPAQQLAAAYEKAWPPVHATLNSKLIGHTRCFFFFFDSSAMSAKSIYGKLAS